MNEYMRKTDTLDARNGWPVDVDELCAMLTVSRSHVVRAIKELGMVKIFENGRASKSMPALGRSQAREIWEWIYMHVEERAFAPGSTSRKIAGTRGCSWLPRWIPPVGEPLPEPLQQYFAEVRRYTGREIAELLKVSPFRVSRVANHLQYKGGRYPQEEARHLVSCILATETKRPSI
jgi:Mn-dependent DtxR family transcriptional regulator